MSRLRKKLADGYAPPSAGFFYNYESEVSPQLDLDEQQFNTLDRDENYWKSDAMNETENPEWSLQEGARKGRLKRSTR